MNRRRTLALAAILAGAFAAVAAAAPGGSTGPSSSQSPYLVRSQAGVVFKSILTTGDSVPRLGGGTYRMVAEAFSPETLAHPDWPGLAVDLGSVWR